MAHPRPAEPECPRPCGSEPAAPCPAGPRTGFGGRLSRWREEQLARRALKQAGDPNLILDLPCGAGRFWPLLAEHPNRVILAADHSADMLAAALASQPAEVAARVKAFQTSAFAIDLHDNAVDSIFCMRLLRRIADPEQRLAMLREFHRVTRDTLIVALFVDGNYQAWKCGQGLPAAQRSRCVVARATVEAEFRQVGFDMVAQQSFLPGYAMGRVYVLRKED